MPQPDAINFRQGNITAPWSDDQVRQLNVFQHDDTTNPFTSSTDADGNDAPQVVLMATSAGWVREIGGPVVCDWAPWYMADAAILEARHRLPFVTIDQIDVLRMLGYEAPYA